MTTSTTLTTRTLVYLDKDAVMKEVSMALLLRPGEDGYVKAGLRFGPPINWEHYLGWEDELHSITYILAIWWIRLYIGGMPLAGNIRWVDGQKRESFHCGLPALRKRPETWTPPEIPPLEENPGDLEVLSGSTLPFPDETGIEGDIPLFVFMPQQVGKTLWKCGFAFGPQDTTPIRYGVGDDFIQSFLDAASMIRLVYEGMVPKGWTSQERDGAELLPYKMGRGYFLDDTSENSTKNSLTRPPPRPD